MVLFNYSTRELTAKIVYYGPGICGKTTNLQFIHENLPGEVRGKMLSLATKTDRTLFFDFLPIDLGEIRGMKTRVQLYTVPGQVFYNETRKLVLKGVDGLVFVADSQETMLGANVESFKNLEENLKAHGMKLAEMPHVIQFNKRDLPKLSPIEDMNAALNKYNAPFYESVATTGIGVQDTLKAIVKLVLLNLTKKYETKSVSEPVAAAVPPAQMPTPAVAATASVSFGSSAGARASTAVATPVDPVPSAGETQRIQIPLSPMEAPAAAPSRPAVAAKSKSAPKSPAPPAPVEPMASFAEDEIDGLVGEVEDIPSLPVAAPVEEGAWMGLPDGEDEPAFATPASTYGSNLAIEELLDDQPAAPSTPEPATPAAWLPTPSARSEFEIDRGFDPEWSESEDAQPTVAATPAPAAPTATLRVPVAAVPLAEAEELVPIAPFPVRASEAMPEDEPDAGVLLTQVASDHDLFSDPSLEIAHLAEGEGREIVVPVLLGEGPHAKRYKLAIRLRLDAVD